MSMFASTRHHHSSAPARHSSHVVAGSKQHSLRGGRSGRYAGVGMMRPAVLALAKLLLLPFASAAPMVFMEKRGGMHALHGVVEEPEEEINKPLYFSVAFALVILGGAFAGLTIALMGQDETYLQVIAASGEGSEQKNAKRVLKLLKNGKHWVLVTLLLSNVITNETLPIVLDRSLGGGWPAVVASSALIVIFGEVAPQSVCVRYGLAIGAYMSPCVLFLMWILCPIAWPTAKLLDWLLGEDHGTMYKKAGLKTLVQLHKTLGHHPAERLMEDEVTIISSVLDLKEKPVGDIMTPMGDVFTMSADTVLDEDMMDTILSQGYSRIPIYAPENHRNFIGMLLVKILITYDPEDCKRVREFALATLPETAPYTSCLDIINFFQEGKSHMVLVSDFPGQDKGALGVVTLEDVIEELIGEEIIDESDVFVDVHKAIRRMAPAPKTRFNKYNFAPEPIVSDSEYSGKEYSEDDPLLAKSSSEGLRKTALMNGHNRPRTTLLMRRRSSTASESGRDQLRPVAVRSSTEDMKQHLKHLGPSNAASHPRATKFSSVKIKPGVSTIPETQEHSSGEATEVPEAPTSHRTSEDIRPVTPVVHDESDLLNSGKAASDGVAAVQAGYGTLSPPPSGSPSGLDKMSASEASRKAEEHTGIPRRGSETRSIKSVKSSKNKRNSPPQSSSPKWPDKVVWGNDAESAMGEIPNPFGGNNKPRVATRSGSITELMVDSGGIRKVVLETTSSSSSDPEDTGSTRKLQLDQDDQKQGEEAEEAVNDDGEGKKRKKKRGKKKNKSNNGSE